MIDYENHALSVFSSILDESSPNLIKKDNDDIYLHEVDHLLKFELGQTYNCNDRLANIESYKLLLKNRKIKTRSMILIILNIFNNLDELLAGIEERENALLAVEELSVILNDAFCKNSEIQSKLNEEKISKDQVFIRLFILFYHNSYSKATIN